jgi:hypothetical protein
VEDLPLCNSNKVALSCVNAVALGISNVTPAVVTLDDTSARLVSLDSSDITVFDGNSISVSGINAARLGVGNFSPAGLASGELGRALDTSTASV